MSVDDVVKTATMDPFGKLMQFIALGVMAFLANLSYDNSLALAGLQADQRSLQQQLTVLTQDRYTGAMAAADKALLLQRIERLEVWTDRLSTRVSSLEETLRDVTRGVQ